MTIGILIAIIIVYLMLTFFLYHLGHSKKIGGLKLGLISLFFTPVTGFIVYFFSMGRMISMEPRYRCMTCNYEFSDNHVYCPHCAAAGKKNKLREVKRNMV